MSTHQAVIAVFTSQNKNACDIYESAAAIQSGASATKYALFCLYGQNHSDTNSGYMNDEPRVHNHECDGILKDNHEW